MTLIGITGAVSSNRADISNQLLISAETRMKSSLDWVYQMAEDGGTQIVCRTFTQTQLPPPSPDFDRLQQELKAQCDWLKKIDKALGPRSARAEVSINILKAVGPPPAGGEQSITKAMTDAIDGYNAALVEVAELRVAGQASTFELIIRFIGPVLLAMGLALRVTKVKGEILIERQKHAIN